MREILFRGKRKDNGEWAYGSLLTHKGFSIFDSIEKNFVTVDSKTIGQYIGSADTDGTKIFEGDIIDATGEDWDCAGPAGHDSPILEVTFDEFTGGFEPFSIYDCDCGVYIRADHCKIIGNIHDNPERLKGE